MKSNIVKLGDTVLALHDGMVRSRGLSTSASLFAAMFASGHLLETLRRVAIKISQRDISAFRFRHVPLRKQVIDF